MLEMLTIASTSLSKVAKLRITNHSWLHTFYVLSFQGIASNLKFPYIQFPCASLSADNLYPLVWSYIQRLKRIGFKVLPITCGASCNRKLLKLHGEIGELVYKTGNPYSDDSRPHFFISDVPHLIKTTRNCLANSFAHSRSRTLWVSEMFTNMVLFYSS